MLFRQLFDSVSCTFTYLLASGTGSEALLIDPVLEKTGRYMKLLEELDLKLAKAIDTHVLLNKKWRQGSHAVKNSSSIHDDWGPWTNLIVCQ